MRRVKFKYRGISFLLRLHNYLRYYFVRNREISIKNVLVGQQSGFPLEIWLKITGENSRLSKLIIDFPYVSFLKKIEEDETRLNDLGFMIKTDYFKMGNLCIRFAGHFMGAKDNSSLLKWMQEYYSFYKRIKNGEERYIKFLSKKGHSKIKEYPILSKIKNSNFYEVIDGHHRIAIMYLRGEKYINAIILGKKYSALQKMLLNINQINAIELYQPVEVNEVNLWPVVRNCKDRFSLMVNFLKKLEIKKGTLIDMACSYGWFTANFKKRGFKVIGIDRDPQAIKIAQLIYKLKSQETLSEKIESFIDRNKIKYDVVLFLSILHHYGLGKEKGDVNDILKKLDRITGKVLFLDSGENHEEWFKKKLPEWDINYIIKKIRENTSFKKIVKLGKDSDNVGRYSKNYGRTLLACVR